MRQGVWLHGVIGQETERQKNNMMLQEFAVLFTCVCLADLIYILIRFRMYRKTKEFSLKGELLKLLFVSYIAAIIAVLLIPRFAFGIDDDSGLFFYFSIPPARFNFHPFQTITEHISLFKNGNPIGMINLFVNTCLFAPLPVLLKMNAPGLKIKTCFFLSFASILACEAVQYFVGRAVDIDDVLLNTAGALLGTMFYQLVRNVWTKKLHKF